MKVIFTIIITLLTLMPVYSMENEPEKFENITFVNDSTEVKQENIRTVFVSLLGLGFSDFMFVRLGYQINKKWSFALKGNIFLWKYTERYVRPAYGVGTRVTYYLSSNILGIVNNYSGEIVLTPAMGKIRAGMIEANAGYENVRDRLVTFYYAIGVYFISLDGRSPYLSPGFKFGMNINF
ncbi:MAG: hypothetical protein Q8N03_06205 [Ignavibacteria bacterium]|nr:hypothetical protein [Ignavibacteria bacterium]MDP3831822.1 hypothetical protein [Ignavibacteriaceae bacterium]